MRLITISLGLLFVGGCNRGGSDRAMLIRSHLASAAASGATTFDFAADPAFAWDRMYVFGCYSSREYVEKTLGVPWPDFGKTSIGSSDLVLLVIFVENGKVVGWYEQPRTIELGGLATEEGFARSEAEFEIDRAAGRVALRVP